LVPILRPIASGLAVARKARNIREVSVADLVIRKWQASKQAIDGQFVVIEGRASGVLSWLLTKFGIDTATRLRVSRDVVYFEQGSLAGFSQRVIPMSRMSSAYFGYEKPWKEALVLGLVLLPLFGLGLILGPLYYIFNKSTAIGVVESSGLINGIRFKRSLIEGQQLTEDDGRRVITIICDLMEASARVSEERVRAA
jgi:hypothetical protein